VVVTVLAGEIELALTARVNLPAGLDERLGLFVIRDRNRLSAGLLAEINRDRKQLAAFERQRRRILLLGAAQIDALLDVDRTAFFDIECRVARRYAAHRLLGIAMAIRAGLAGRAGVGRPRRLAVERRERRRVRRVVVLHRLGVTAHEFVAGAAFGEGSFRDRERGEQYAEYNACHSGRAEQEPESIATISIKF